MSEALLLAKSDTQGLPNSRGAKIQTIIRPSKSLAQVIDDRWTLKSWTPDTHAAVLVRLFPISAVVELCASHPRPRGPGELECARLARYGRSAGGRRRGWRGAWGIGGWTRTSTTTPSTPASNADEIDARAPPGRPLLPTTSVRKLPSLSSISWRGPWQNSNQFASARRRWSRMWRLNRRR